MCGYYKFEGEKEKKKEEVLLWIEQSGESRQEKVGHRGMFRENTKIRERSSVIDKK